jgi:hypothetical protein
VPKYEVTWNAPYSEDPDAVGSFQVYGCLNNDDLRVSNRTTSRSTLREVMELIQADLDRQVALETAQRNALVKANIL